MSHSCISFSEGMDITERGKPMTRFNMSIAVVLAVAVAFAGAALAKQPPKTAGANKANICHFTGKKYVALTVGKSALATHTAHHQDLIGAPVPQGTTRARQAAARSFCAKLPVLTATRGGEARAASLTSTTVGLTGSTNVRARLGQGQLCLKLTVTSTTTPVTVSAIKLMQGTTTLATLDLSTLSSLTGTTSPLQLSGCANVNRSLVKQLLSGTGTT